MPRSMYFLIGCIKHLLLISGHICYLDMSLCFLVVGSYVVMHVKLYMQGMLEVSYPGRVERKQLTPGVS